MSILTQRLSGIFRMFRPVELKLHGDEHVIRAKRNTERTNQLAINLSDEETVDLDPAELQVAIEKHPGMMKRLKIARGGGRETAMQELRRGYNEVVDLARSVRVALDQQSTQTAKMAEVLDKLPRALESLPETNRNQGRMVEAMHSFLQQQELRDGQMQVAIGEMAARNDQQTEILMVMQQQFDVSQANQQVMHQTMGKLCNTLFELSTSSSDMTTAMVEIATRMENRDEQVADLVKGQRRGLMMAAAVGALLMLAGLGAGWYVGSQQVEPGVTGVNNVEGELEAVSSAVKPD